MSDCSEDEFIMCETVEAIDIQSGDFLPFGDKLHCVMFSELLISGEIRLSLYDPCDANHGIRILCMPLSQDCLLALYPFEIIAERCEINGCDHRRHAVERMQVPANSLA